MEITEVLHKKNVLNPKLRFKEFNGDWKIDSLTNLYSEIVVGFVGTVSSDYCGEKEGVQFVRTLNVKDGWFSNEGLQYVSKTFHLKNKKSQVKNGDILIARVGANMGLVCEINGLIGEANSANVIIIKNQTNLSSRFYASYLSSSKGQKQIQSKGAGGAQEVLNISVAKTITVPVLTLPEQQKIASFLSAVDEKIQQLSRKKELLESYKKGVMQQLFSGKLRFNDENGKAFPRWEEKKLGEIGKFYAGGDLDKLDYRKEKAGTYIYPIYSNGVGEGLYGYATTFQYTANCVTVSGRGNLGYANVRKQNFNAIVRLIVIEPKQFISSKYLEEIINNINFVVESTGVPQLTVPQISSYKINIPCLAEQNKVADYLSNIDNKTETITKEITQTQTFKKGLLQQMFV